MFVPATSAQPVELVEDAGTMVAYLFARDRVAYWSALALPNTLGLADTQSGGVMRVIAPCD